MNERIEKLAEQAAKQVNNDLRKEDESKWYSDLPMDQSKFQEKFAELIVQDCIKIMHEQEHLPPGHFHSQNALTHEYAIKKHFGFIE